MNLDLDRSNWERVCFGDVVRQGKEAVNPTDGTVDRYVAGEHMDTDELNIRSWGDVNDGYVGPAFHRRFHAGQVLYGSRRTYLRKVAVADFGGVCANTTFVLETKDPTRLSQLFLPFLMTSEPFHAFAIQESKGSVNPYINFSDLARFEFALPPLDEQQSIAELLWAAENHRRHATALVDSVTSAADTVFDEALSTGHSNGWPTVPVTSLVTAGPTNGKSATANDQQRGIPTLSISAVRDGRILGGAAVKYVDIDRSAVENFILLDGDFLVVRGNGNKQLTALGGMVRGGLPDNCFYPDLLIRLRFDEAVIRPDFAARQWNAPRAHGALLRSAKSTNGIWKINGKDIKSHRLVVPPLDAQDALLARVEAMGAALQSAQIALSDITILKTALINGVFE